MAVPLLPQFRCNDQNVGRGFVSGFLTNLAPFGPPRACFFFLGPERPSQTYIHKYETNTYASTCTRFGLFRFWFDWVRVDHVSVRLCLRLIRFGLIGVVWSGFGLIRFGLCRTCFDRLVA